MVTNQIILRSLAAIVSGILLAAGFVDDRCFPLTWIAFIPFFWSLSVASGTTERYLLGLLCGSAMFAFGANWIVDFVHLLKGYDDTSSFLLGILFWFCSAQIFALASVLYARLRRNSDLPDLLLLPTLFTVFMHYFPTLFPPTLGITQIRFHWVLQGLDLLGEQALTFIIVMVNVLVLNVLRTGIRAFKNSAAGIAIVLLSAWMGYGIWASQHWHTTIAQWSTLTLGLIQPNETPSLERAGVKAGYSRTFPVEMEMSQRLAAAGASWIIWPETRYKGYFDHAYVQAAYQRNVAALQVPLLFQDMAQQRLDTTGKSHLQNGAIMLDAQGQPFPPHFKMKRVAFGEYIPLIHELPMLLSFVKTFLGNFSDEITPGIKQEYFELPGFKVLPLICFEVMFPEFVASGVRNRAPGAILAVLSSNGWFGNTVQPYQHLHASALRAVENRLPLVHAMNNGPSAVIQPDGQIIFKTPYHQAGEFLVNMPYSPVTGGSFYSRFPSVFPVLCWLILGYCLLAPLLRRS